MASSYGFNWETVQGAMIHGTFTVPFEMLLRALIGVVHDELEHIKEDIKGLIRGPLFGAERALNLAQRRPAGSTERDDGLREARKLFCEAAANVEGVPASAATASKALIAASMCSVLLGDDGGAAFYRNEAEKVLKNGRDRLVEEHRSFSMKATKTIFFGSGVASMGTIAVGCGYVIAGFFTGGAAPIALSVGSAALIGVTALTSNPLTKLSCSLREIDECGEFIFGRGWVRGCSMI
jgi:hypothetical protein